MLEGSECIAPAQSSFTFLQGQPFAEGKNLVDMIFPLHVLCHQAM